MIGQQSLLGLAGYLDNGRVQALITSLSAIWERSMGRQLGDLEGDLAACRRWFDPVAQGQRLRRDLPTIPAVDETTWDPGPPLTLQVDPRRLLVTPEGRCALDLLLHVGRAGGETLIADAELIPYDRRLGHLYRAWSRHRLESVVGLLAGRQKPLQIAAAGVVIALLVNRSTSPARALKRFAASSPRDVIDKAFFDAVQAFGRALAPRQRATRDPRLISGWMLYEARRRLGDDVLIVEGARPNKDARFWIEESKEDEVLDLLARDLGRGRRGRITADTLSAALESLVRVFRSRVPHLAGFGLAHEQPANTRKLCEQLVRRFRQYAEDH